MGLPVSHNLPREILFRLAPTTEHDKLSLSADYLGQYDFRCPRYCGGYLYHSKYSGRDRTIPIPTIKAVTGYVYLNNGSIGFKYELLDSLLLTANLLVKLDNNGLRQNVTPLLALSYAIGH